MPPHRRKPRSSVSNASGDATPRSGPSSYPVKADVRYDPQIGDYLYSAGERKAIRHFLRLRKAAARQGLESIDGMECPQLEDWCQKMRVYWTGTIKAISWCESFLNVRMKRGRKRPR